MSPDGAVHLRTADGAVHQLTSGDVVGRLWSAALSLQDPRVSECHAAVSIRDGRPVLLGLRGRFRVDGEVVRDVVLGSGQRIELAPGVRIDVVRVELPWSALHVQVDDGPDVRIRGVVTLCAAPPHVRPGIGADGETLWGDGEGWFHTSSSGSVSRVVDRSSWSIGRTRFTARVLPTDGATEQQVPPAHRLGLEEGRATLTVGTRSVRFTGRAATLLAELGELDRPVPWAQIAALVWSDVPEAQLRKRWDRLLARIRDRLRCVGARPNFLLADGTGLVQLVLAEHDEVRWS